MLMALALTLHPAAPYFDASAVAQSPPVNGMRPADLRTHAIVDATVITSPGTSGAPGAPGAPSANKIEHATIIIRDGVITDVGSNIQVPAGARVWNATGMTIYPGLIDAALLVKPGDASGARSAGAHWNSRIHSELSMAEQPAPDKSLRKDMRAMGFTAAAVYPANGALRGSGVVLALADENEHVLIYRQRAAMAAGFDYGGAGRGGGGGGGTA